MIRDVLNTDLYTAMKNKDSFKTEALRYLLAQIKNKEIEVRAGGAEFTDDEIMKVFKKQMKERKQSIEQYEQAGRAESVAKEQSELKLLEEYYVQFGGDLSTLNQRPQ